MLQSIRDSSQSIVAKIIVGLIIVTFALFGVESLVSLTAESNAPATVNGEEISQQELYQATELQRRQLLSQMGDNADPALLDDGLISAMVLDSLIEQKSIILAAQEKDMIISDRMIDQMIINTPDFQVDGQFNRDQFEAALRNAGFSPLMYRALLKKERLVEQQRNAYQLSAFAVPSELDRIIALDSQTRDISYFILPISSAEKNIKISEEDVKEKYETEKSTLRTLEQVAIEYILLDKNNLRENVEVSEAELKAQYDQFLATYQAEEQRAVSHILVEVTAEQDDKAALEKITAVQARIKAGESFDVLAKSESDDLGSASSGGDLGLNGKGVFSAPFEASMFALALNEVSEPVRTEFGYHLIKVTDVAEKNIPDFAEMKYKLTDDILDQKVEAIYVERLELMADITFSAGDLIEPAEVMGLTIQESKPFDRAGGEVDITRNAKVIAAAFSSDLIKEKINSEPIELDRERTVVVRVKNHLEPRIQTFDEVASLLKQQLVEELAGDALATTAKQAVGELVSGKAITELSVGADIINQSSVSRASNDLPESVRALAFSLAKPEEGRVVASTTELEDGSVAVVRLNKVNYPEIALEDDEKKSMAIFLATRFGQQEYQSLVAQLKNRAQIEKK